MPIEHYPFDQPYKYWKMGPVYYAECLYDGCESGEDGAPFKAVRKLRPQVRRAIESHIGSVHYGKIALDYEDSTLAHHIVREPAPRYNPEDPLPF